MSEILGDDIWAVFVNGVKYKGDMTLKKAEALAERHQRGLCKHKDFRDHVELRRDRDVIRQVGEFYKEAKAGNMQKYEYQGWKDDGQV